MAHCESTLARYSGRRINHNHQQQQRKPPGSQKPGSQAAKGTTTGTAAKRTTVSQPAPKAAARAQKIKDRLKFLEIPQLDRLGKEVGRKDFHEVIAKHISPAQMRRANVALKLGQRNISASSDKDKFAKLILDKVAQ